MRATLVAAPLLMFGYGVVRLIDGFDGSHGPGPAWTIGHLMFLVALGLFGDVIVTLVRRLWDRRGVGIAAAVTAVVAFVGLAAFVQTIVVDIVAGLRASGSDEMHDLQARYAGPLPDALGPLFMVGLVVLLVLAAVVRRGPWWGPVLVLVGCGAISANLDLLPLGGLLFLAALVPLARARDAASPVPVA